MAKLETLSETVFNNKVQHSYDVEPLQKQTQLSQIEIIDFNTIKLNDAYLHLTDRAFKDLLKTMLVGKRFYSKFNKLFDQENSQKFFNKLKDIISLKDNINKKGDVNLTLFANPQTKEIVSIKNTKNIDHIPNSTFFNLIEDAMSNFNLEVNKFYINTDGSLKVNCVNPQYQKFIPNLKEDEDFVFGVTFENSLNDGIKVNPYAVRLICSNGIEIPYDKSMSQIKKVNKESYENFFSDLKNFKESYFIPSNLFDRINKADYTYASFNELERAWQSINKSKLSVDNSVLNHWVPYQTIFDKFVNFGVNPDSYSVNAKKKAKTDQTIWQLINGLTHFASHDQGFDINDNDRSRIQREAGNFLKNEFDFGDIMKSPF